MDEFSFIEYLKKKIPNARRVSVGIGDDAAVMSVHKGKKLVVSTDVVVENVDFRIKTLSPERIGRKALAVNLSDLAAMGASPMAFVINIGKPSYVSTSWLKRFYDGLLTLAKKYNVACVGGDFSKSKEFFASVTILGEVFPDQAVNSSGATARDWIGVTGSLGGSLLRHHYDFTPRVKEGDFLAREDFVSSMIDVSDGLVQDLTHVLRASKVGAALDLGAIPVSREAMKMAKGNRNKALERALSDGEDFELLFTAPACKKLLLEKIWTKHFPEVPLAWIGRIQGKTPRISWHRDAKKVTPPKLAQKGYSHF